MGSEDVLGYAKTEQGVLLHYARPTDDKTLCGCWVWEFQPGTEGMTGTCSRCREIADELLKESVR